MNLTMIIMAWALIVCTGGQPNQKQAIEALKKIDADITVKEGASGKELSISFAGSSVTNEKMKHLEQLPQVCSIDL